MILVNVLLGFLQFFRAIPIMNPLPWFMIARVHLVSHNLLESHRNLLKAHRKLS